MDHIPGSKALLKKSKMIDMIVAAEVDGFAVKGIALTDWCEDFEKIFLAFIISIIIAIIPRFSVVHQCACNEIVYANG